MSLVAPPIGHAPAGGLGFGAADVAPFRGGGDAPALHHLFEGASSLPGAAVVGPPLTLVRNSTKTYFDAAGVLQTAAIDAPALGHEYNGSSWVHKGFRHSKARTSLLTQNEELDNAAWTKTGGLTITPDDAVAPDGTTTMDKLVQGAAASRLTRNYTAGATASHTLYLYCKKVDSETQTVALFNNTTAQNIAKATFNLDTVTVASTVAGTCRIREEGAGMLRLKLSSSSGVTSGDSLQVIIYGGDDIGDVTSVHAWGVDLFEEPYVEGLWSEHIKTTTAQATQDADQLSIAVADFDWNDASGKFYMRFTPHFADEGLTIQYALLEALQDGNNKHQWYVNTSGVRTGQLILQVKGAGLTQAIEAANDAVETSGVEVEAAYEFDATDFTVAHDGTLVGPQTSPATLPSPTALKIAGHSFVDIESIDGWLAEFKYWNDNTKGDPIEDLTA